MPRHVLAALAAGIIATPFAAGAAEYAATDAYSSPTQRAFWTELLASESQIQPIVDFHPLGHLRGLSGRFSLPNTDIETVREWANAHSELFGFPDAELVYSDSTPIHSFLLSGMEDYPTSAAISGTSVSFSFRSKERDIAGMRVRFLVTPKESAIIGVFNDWCPLLGQMEAISDPISEAAAWEHATDQLGAATIHPISSEYGWADISWIMDRIPGSIMQVWTLVGVDELDRTRRIIVNATTGHVEYASSGDWYAVPGWYQYHYGFSDGELYWTDEDPMNTSGCNAPGTPGGRCDPLIYNESLTSRVKWPATTYGWFAASIAENPIDPSQLLWPFAPLDGRQIANNPLWRSHLYIYVAADSKACQGRPPCKEGRFYYFRPQDLTFDLVGHEYGHEILDKIGWYRVDTTTSSQAGVFTDGLADYFGIINERARLGYTDWAIPNVTDWKQTIDPCTADPRRLVGAIILRAWERIESHPYYSPSTAHYFFEALWREVSWALKALETTKHPTISDFAAAVISHQPLVELCGNLPQPCSISRILLEALQENGFVGGCNKSRP